MIRLQNVSKFYYNKGIIASGFSRINLEFKMGEFVAITGESGSGKSTLLNVISGLDTYEEGEMYINGGETSHYSEKDFEDYRRKYIGNIFQNFNLVNSYTVYQNIELVLLLNGFKKKDIKNKVLELIKKVNLYKFRNTKVSKLSGGQKQRVAIARALAKDTPIIIADEPTGNLDTESAHEIIRLLSEISQDKLVIIVTHNYGQVEKYVTRKIKMHDGKVLEDKHIKEVVITKQHQEGTYKNITLANKLRLGIRNTFNIIPKFLLIFAVYLFIVVALMSQYSSYLKDSEQNQSKGNNYLIQNATSDRIILNKLDRTPINSDDYKTLSGIKEIKKLIKDDLIYDLEAGFSNQDLNIWMNAILQSIDEFKVELSEGKMPENDNEIVVVGNKNNYQFYNIEVGTKLGLNLYADGSDLKVEVVGIAYTNDPRYSNLEIYAADEYINQVREKMLINSSKIKILFKDKYYNSNYYDVNWRLKASDNVALGSAYISSDFSYLCKDYNCVNEVLNIDSSSFYYDNNFNLTVSKMYDNKNFKTLIGRDMYAEENGTIYVNPADYARLSSSDIYQSSILVKEFKDIDKVNETLKSMGYDTLVIRDTLVSSGASEVQMIISVVMTTALLLTLFFISYFVIRIILKSRNVYFSIIRMLGATKKISKQLLIIELLQASMIAYLSFIGILYLQYIKVIQLGMFDTIINYLNPIDYIVVLVILLGMSYLISIKFAKKLFGSSAVSVIKEEV